MASIQKYHHSATRPGSSSMESLEPASLLEANIRAGVTNESHLQSLGFVIDNGKPRFKIDEPVDGAIGLSMSRSNLPTMPGAPSSFRSEEEESFVVLGKDSLSSIQASSLASYAQIQQKSLSMDYNSIISSLTAEETEKKLRELLQENVKLKETLKQNNLAMKQQFNTLAAWQEEIMKVHQNHKQKFSETKELINQLRRENADLKIKASQESVASSDHNSKVKELESQLEKTVLGKSAKELELEEANNKLANELSDSKIACNVLTADVNRQTALTGRLNQQLRQAELTIEGLKLDLERVELNLREKEQLASFVDFSLLSTSIKQREEFETSKEKSREQEMEIKSLRELVASLEHQIKVTNENPFTSLEIKTGDRPPAEDRSQFIRNVKQYNEILTSLSEAYAKQGTRYINVQESLRESIELLQDLKTEDVGTQEKLSKLVNCRDKLNDERLERIKERQELITAQSQFQKIFSDYNSVLYELEIMYEENAKLSCLQDKNIELTTEERNTKGSAVNENENLIEEKKSLEEMRASILLEKTNIAEDKKSNDALRNECEKLKESMRQMELVNEAEKKVLQAEKKEFQKAITDLETKNTVLENNLKLELIKVDDSTAEIKSLKEEIEIIPVLRAQLESYKSDFDDEREARTRMSEKNDVLVNDLKKLQKMHTDLLENLNQQDCVMIIPHQDQHQYQHQNQHQHQSSASGGDSGAPSAPVITAFSCPKCSLAFKALRPLQEHVEECLQLQ